MASYLCLFWSPTSNVSTYAWPSWNAPPSPVLVLEAHSLIWLLSVADWNGLSPSFEVMIGLVHLISRSEGFLCGLSLWGRFFGIIEALSSCSLRMHFLPWIVPVVIVLFTSFSSHLLCLSSKSCQYCQFFFCICFFEVFSIELIFCFASLWVIPPLKWVRTRTSCSLPLITTLQPLMRLNRSKLRVNRCTSVNVILHIGLRGIPYDVIHSCQHMKYSLATVLPGYSGGGTMTSLDVIVERFPTLELLMFTSELRLPYAFKDGHFSPFCLWISLLWADAGSVLCASPAKVMSCGTLDCVINFCHAPQ